MIDENISAVIICQLWRLRSPLSEGFAVKQECHFCGEDIVIDKGNVARMQKNATIVAACLECVLKPEIIENEGVSLGGAMIDGKLHTNPTKALEAIQERINETRKKPLDN